MFSKSRFIFIIDVIQLLYEQWTSEQLKGTQIDLVHWMFWLKLLIMFFNFRFYILHTNSLNIEHWTPPPSRPVPTGWAFGVFNLILTKHQKQQMSQTKPSQSPTTQLPTLSPLNQIKQNINNQFYANNYQLSHHQNQN